MTAIGINELYAFIDGKSLKAKSQSGKWKSIKSNYPLAKKIIKVDNGYLVFYSVSDWEKWKGGINA